MNKKTKITLIDTETTTVVYEEITPNNFKERIISLGREYLPHSLILFRSGALIKADGIQIDPNEFPQFPINEIEVMCVYAEIEDNRSRVWKGNVPSEWIYY